MAEPIKELITQNLATVLATVTVANGYHQNLDVYRVDPSGIKFMPWATYLCELDDTEDSPARLCGKVCWIAPYQIAVYADIHEGDVAGQVVSRIEADIQKALLVDLTRGGYAVNTFWQPPERSTNEKGELIGTLCTVNVHYRTNDRDPYTL